MRATVTARTPVQGAICGNSGGSKRYVHGVLINNDNSDLFRCHELVDCTFRDMHQSVDPPAPVLWSLHGFGDDRRPARSSYWWDNRQRRPHDVVTIQCTLGGAMWFQDAHGVQRVGIGQAALF